MIALMLSLLKAGNLLKYYYKKDLIGQINENIHTALVFYPKPRVIEGVANAQPNALEAR
jgi:hypothetical protein